MHSDSCFLYQKWLKSVHDKWLKGRVVFVTEKKHVLKPLGGTLGAISLIFVSVHTVVPHLYSRLHPDLSRFGEL